MVFISKLKGTLVAVFALALIGYSNAAFSQAPAQNQQQKTAQNISDSDLKKFVKASEGAMAVQQQNEEKMMQIIEKENLSIQKFNEMAMAQQQQQSLDNVEATAEEKAAFNNAAQKIMDMQPQLQKEMEAAVVKEGLTVEKFQNIMMAYQQDPAIQAKVQKLLEQ